jgi:hypothetical protein
MCVCALLLAGVALAASIDGKWKAERKMERDGQAFTIIQTFELKSDGAKLTGKVTMQFGDMEPRTADVKDGKIDGSKFSFTTIMQGPNGDMKTTYTGTVEGDALKGQSEREGGQGPRPFEAKKL